MDQWPPSPPLSQPSTEAARDRAKKPRHRHSPTQLAALNELYEKNEHPSLEQRTSLAERLGMETKTVNAWFQNKRASSKKRIRGAPSDVPAILPHLPSTSTTSSVTNTPRHAELDDFHDDEFLDTHHSLAHITNSTSFYASPDTANFLTESDNMPRRMRMRPSPEQTEELRRVYNVNPHPTTDERQALAERIGMRYQSITNWFQNQRSLAKKRKEDEVDMVAFPAAKATSLDYPNEARTYSAFPPPSHSSLSLPVSNFSSPSLAYPPRSRRSPSNSPPADESAARGFAPQRSVTPYSRSARPRRSRPEPYQLDALKDLYMKTPTPSIEERAALALEIGMDLGKVTNWFRNLRQTARKRAKKTGDSYGSHGGSRDHGSDEDEDDAFHLRHPHSAYVSRAGSSTFNSPPSSLNGDGYYERNGILMDLDEDYEHSPHSDVGSDDDYQEAVTPSPEGSPSPIPTAATASNSTVDHVSASSRVTFQNFGFPIDAATYAEFEKAAARHRGIRVEDALLLLGFHQQVVH